MLNYLIGHLETREKKRLGWLLVLCLAAPVIDLFSVSMIIPILNEAMGQDADPGLILRILVLGTVFLLKGVFELVRSRTANRFLHECTQLWSVKIYRLFCQEELPEHNRKDPSQAIAGVMRDPETCGQLITLSLDLFVSLLTLAGYFVVIVYVAGWIGVASCGLIGLAMFLLAVGNYIRIGRYGERKRRIEVRANSLISTAFGAYKELKIDSRWENMLRKFDSASAEYAQIQKDYAFIRTVLGILLVNVMQAFLFYFLAGILAAGLSLTSLLAEIVVYITLLIRMIPVANTAVTGLSAIQYGRRYYEAFRENLDAYEALMERRERQSLLRERALHLERGITVEGLTFGYTEGELLFENASITIPAGKAVAVTGMSGMGKTTFLDLLLGLLRPSAGRICFDDYDIVTGCDSQGPCRVELGKLVSYIPQVVYLYGNTVRNNVVFMSDEENGDEEQIIQCLKSVRVWEDVRRMPRGLDSVIGVDGKMLSGGQRQRIALARALYKDFELLIMDEATAALDMDTEKAVIESIRDMKRGRTLLMVTHHQSLAEECDCIYRIQDRGFVRVR